MTDGIPFSATTGIRIIDYFDRGVALASSQICMIDGETQRTYAEVDDRSRRIATGLIGDGLTAGAHAAVLCGNAAIAFECILGLLRADAVWVTANHRAGVGEVSYLLDLLDVDTLFFHSDVLDRVAVLRERCPKIRRYVAIDRPLAEADAYVGDWLGLPSARVAQRRYGAPDDLAMLVNTGGTTGRPKGVMWTNRTWSALVSSLDASMPMVRPPVNLVAAPMTHAAGPLALASMAAGGTIVIVPKFDPLEVMQAIERYRVTYLFLPPTAIYMMLAHPDVASFNLSSLEYLCYAGAPMSPSKLSEAIARFGPVLHGSFGQTEAPMCLTAIRPDEHVDAMGQLRRPGTCGRATLHSRVEIMDDNGAILGSGERGEIVAKGPLVMTGYYNDPAASENASAFGWHHTGDIGIRDDAGWFTIVDRKKDMIITGGFNVYPAEVEVALLSHPSTQDCAVVGIPDEKWGEAVCAVIELKAGEEGDVATYESFVRDLLGPVKTPKRFEFVDRLPRSAVGKVLRSEVRQRFWTEAGRSI